jgi:hypothetical protein
MDVVAFLEVMVEGRKAPSIQMLSYHCFYEKRYFYATSAATYSSVIKWMVVYV